MGQDTETVKVYWEEKKLTFFFRKDSEKFEQAKKKIYQISCEDCEKIYIGETKFTLRKRMEQHKKEVKFGRTSNAIAKHVEESKCQIDWDKTTY